MSYNAYEGSLQSDYNLFDDRDSSTFLHITQDKDYFNTTHRKDGSAQHRDVSYRLPEPEIDGTNQQFHVQSDAPPPIEHFAIVDGEPNYTSGASRPVEETHGVPGRGYPSSSSNRVTSSAPFHRSDDRFRVAKESHLHKEVNSTHPTQDEHTWPIRERNRQAAIRFRMRQREGVARLKSVEQAVEQRHEELRNHVNSLNKEIMCLKMQVLQHTNCGCIPVHHYVEQEAQQYLQSMNPM